MIDIILSRAQVTYRYTAFVENCEKLWQAQPCQFWGKSSTANTDLLPRCHLVLEFQTDHSRTLHSSTNWKRNHSGGEWCCWYFWAVLRRIRTRLVCAVGHTSHSLLSFFVLLLSRHGGEREWGSDKDCRKVWTSGRRRVHACLSAEWFARFPCVAYQKLSFRLIQSSLKPY